MPKVYRVSGVRKEDYGFINARVRVLREGYCQSDSKEKKYELLPKDTRKILDFSENFNWGYEDIDGARQLSLAILYDLTEDENFSLTFYETLSDLKITLKFTNIWTLREADLVSFLVEEASKNLTKAIDKNINKIRKKDYRNPSCINSSTAEMDDAFEHLVLAKALLNGVLKYD